MMLGDGEPEGGVAILLILALIYMLTNSPSTNNTSNEPVELRFEHSERSENCPDYQVNTENKP